MDRRALLAVYRVGFATLTTVAIVTVAADAIARGAFVPLNFFSYFTIQSNLIAIAVFLLGAAWTRREPSAGWELVRGGAVVYITVTLVVFALLLSDVNVDTQLPWVDTVVHRVMPIAVIVDWLIDPPRHRIPFRSSLVWLAYPLVWIGYTLVRGPLAGWYPYPFLDPADGGYGSVAVYVVAIFGFGTLLCALVAWVGSTLGARRVGDAARRGPA
jgi:hypothetical protein